MIQSCFDLLVPARWDIVRWLFGVLQQSSAVGGCLYLIVYIDFDSVGEIMCAEI